MKVFKGLRIEKDLVSKIEGLAKEDSRSFSSMAVLLIEKGEDGKDTINILNTEYTMVKSIGYLEYIKHHLYHRVDDE